MNTIVVEAISKAERRKEVEKGQQYHPSSYLDPLRRRQCQNFNYGIDPVLCLYVGAYLLLYIMKNKFLQEKVPRGNGTLCRLVLMKLKQNATTYKPKSFYNKKGMDRMCNIC